MPKVRIGVPAHVADEVLFANRHRCCVCHEPRKPVHIHHIDENPGNNDPGNLAVLCLDHHSDVTGNEGLGRDYSENEIRLFKENWEAECETSRSNSDDEPDSDDEESVEPIHNVTKRVILDENEHLYHSFELDEGDEITFSLSSDERIEFLIMTKRQYNRWAEDQTGTLYEQHTDITELEDSFTVPKTANWLLIFCNHGDEEVEIWFSISTWPAE